MEFGFYLPNSGEGAQPDALASIARLGDRLGFHCMVAPDHFLMPREVSSVYPLQRHRQHPSRGQLRRRRVARADYHAGLFLPE